MSDRSLKELSPDEFQEMTDGMLGEDFDKVTPDEFFGALAAMDEAEEETIELAGHIEHGELVLEQPAPLPVNRNEIRVQNRRIVIKLRPAASAS